MGTAYDNLIPLIKKTGSKLSPKEFHKEVSVIFHDIEAQHYDNIHKNMWKSLQFQYAFIAKKITPLFENKNSLKVLDIGCGTGLSTSLLLDTPLKSKIKYLTLLDSSSEMLSKAAEKVKGSGIPYELIHGEIQSLNNKEFDIIQTCSVLHHIPDLGPFANHIGTLQSKGGVFFHLQDPNSKLSENKSYIKRVNELKNIKKPKKGLTVKRIGNYLKRRLLGIKTKTYKDLVNEKLIASGVITNIMTDKEIWSVTDIHVEGLPYSTQEGISTTSLKNHLKDYQLVSEASYAFFGDLYHDLPPALKNTEMTLFKQGDMNGRNTIGIWQKN